MDDGDRFLGSGVVAVTNGIPSGTLRSTFLLPLLLLCMSTRISSIIGWICTALVAALTIFSGVMEFIMPMTDPEIVAYVTRLGIVDMEYPLGAAKLLIAALYLVPRTSTVGFVLMVGYYGGALATNITHAVPLAEYFPIIVVLALLTVDAVLRKPELLTRLKGKPVIA